MSPTSYKYIYITLLSILHSLLLNLLLICWLILTKSSPRRALCRRIRIGLVQKMLYPYHYLFHGDSGTPVLLLVQNAQTYGAGWVYIGMVETCWKFNLGRFRRVIVRKRYRYRINSFCPKCILFSRYSCCPVLQIQ